MVDTNSYKQKTSNSDNMLKRSNNDAKKKLNSSLEQQKKSKEDMIAKFRNFKNEKPKE